MIGIPYELRPSTLVWIGDLCQAAQDLRSSCCRFASAGDLRVVDAWYNDAEKLLAGGQDSGCAVIMICLADLYRDAGRLAQARECCERAEQLSTYSAEILHRYNHAVALYSLGVIHQLLGSDREAMNRYDEAVAEFDRARKQWIIEGSEHWRKQCDLIMRWIGQLREQVADAWSHGRAPVKTMVSVPLLSRIAAGDPLLADQNFDEWVQLDVKLADRINFVLEVQGNSMQDAGIYYGARVLIEQNQAPPPDGQIVAILLDQRGGEATLKKYYRERDHIRLEPANISYPFIILKENAVPVAPIEAWYAQHYPGRRRMILTGVEPHIVGWVRGVM